MAQTKQKYVENFVHEPQILPQKPKIAEKLNLIGQNGYSFSYMWPLIEWNQVKYPKQHLLFFILFPSVMLSGAKAAKIRIVPAKLVEF